MFNQRLVIWSCLVFLVQNAFAFPNQDVYHRDQVLQQQSPVYIPQRMEDRKFAEKPNAIKKVSFDDIAEIKNNEIGEPIGFSWSSIMCKDLNSDN